MGRLSHLSNTQKVPGSIPGENILFPRGLTARISGFHPEGPGSTPGVGIFCLIKNLVEVCSDRLKVTWRAMDEVAEWLRRWTANPMCSARVGSNPILVVDFLNLAFKNMALLLFFFFNNLRVKHS